MKKNISQKAAYDFAVYMNKKAETAKKPVEIVRVVIDPVSGDHIEFIVTSSNEVCITTFYGRPTKDGRNINEVVVGTPEQFYKAYKLLAPAVKLGKTNNTSNTKNVPTLIAALEEMGFKFGKVNGNDRPVRKAPGFTKTTLRRACKAAGWKSQGKDLFPCSEGNYYLEAKKAGGNSQAVLNTETLFVLEHGNW